LPLRLPLRRCHMLFAMLVADVIDMLMFSAARCWRALIERFDFRHVDATPCCHYFRYYALISRVYYHVAGYYYEPCC